MKPSETPERLSSDLNAMSVWLAELEERIRGVEREQTYLDRRTIGLMRFR